MLAVCALLGCTTSGAYLEANKAHELEQSVTTAQQLESALGTPSVTIPLEDGKVMWVYQRIHKRMNAAGYIPYVNLMAGGNKKQCTRLTVLVDKDTGKLSDWQYSTEQGSEFWARTNDRCKPDEKNDQKAKASSPPAAGSTSGAT